MVRIVLDEEQTNLMAGTTTPVSLFDRSGNLVGVAQPTKLSASELEELLRRATDKGPFRTTAEVLERLRQLETATPQGAP